MHLEIVTPDRKIFSGKVNLVQVPGTKGSFEVLEYHAPIVSTLEKGKIKINDGGHDTYFKIGGGLIEVKDNTIIILAESVDA